MKNILAQAIAIAPKDGVVLTDDDLNFNPNRFAKELRKATLPTHVVETQEEADQINEWVKMVTDLREDSFKVGDQYFLLPMHA